MTNVTLSIEEEDLKRARIIALQNGTSLNAVIRGFVKGYIGDSRQYQSLTDRVLRHATESKIGSQGQKWDRDSLYER